MNCKKVPKELLFKHRFANLHRFLTKHLLKDYKFYN